MKILHTSDWHVGRTIRGRSRHEEHREVLTEIVEIANEREVDLVIVAGDQFDNAAPSPDSERLVYRALLDLADAGRQVVVLAGNHDSWRRWRAVEAPFELSGEVHLAYETRGPEQGGVLDLLTNSGETARLALLPWLSQRSIVSALDLIGRDAFEHEQTFSDRVRRLVEALTAGFSGDVVNLIAAHLTVASGVADLSDGVRKSQSILEYVVSPQVFGAGAQYVALGHLHLAHQVPGPCPIWYSGSPLHLDFGEADRGPKSVNVVTVEPGQPARIETVALTAGRRLRTLRGTPSEIESAAAAHRDEFLRVILDEIPATGVSERLRETFPEIVDVLVVPREDDEAEDVPDFHSLQRSPSELFDEYLQAEHIDDPALSDLFRDLLEEWEEAARAS